MLLKQSLKNWIMKPVSWIVSHCELSKSLHPYSEETFLIIINVDKGCAA